MAAALPPMGAPPVPRRPSSFPFCAAPHPNGSTDDEDDDKDDDEDDEKRVSLGGPKGEAMLLPRRL